MNIIHRGIKPAERRHTVRCTSCSSVMELSESEAKRVSDQRDGDYMSFDCPVCSRLVTFTPRPEGTGLSQIHQLQGHARS